VTYFGSVLFFVSTSHFCARFGWTSRLKCTLPSLLFAFLTLSHSFCLCLRVCSIRSPLTAACPVTVLNAVVPATIRLRFNGHSTAFGQRSLRSQCLYGRSTSVPTDTLAAVTLTYLFRPQYLYGRNECRRMGVARSNRSSTARRIDVKSWSLPPPVTGRRQARAAAV